MSQYAGRYVPTGSVLCCGLILAVMAGQLGIRLPSNTSTARAIPSSLNSRITRDGSGICRKYTLVISRSKILQGMAVRLVLDPCTYFADQLIAPIANDNRDSSMHACDCPGDLEREDPNDNGKCSGRS
jgi:hypothetical protein